MEDGTHVKKRKRSAGVNGARKKVSHQPEEINSRQDDYDEITTLEKQIEESQKNYNNIAKLITKAKSEGEARSLKSKLPATVSLCRVFSRLLAEGRLYTSKIATQNEATIIEWLQSRYAEYKLILLKYLQDSRLQCQSTALTLGMQLVKSEVDHGRQDRHSRWRNGLFGHILKFILDDRIATEARLRFLEEYFLKFDDVRHYTLVIVADTLEQTSSAKNSDYSSSGALELMLSMESIESGSTLNNFLCSLQDEKTHSKPISASTHRKAGQRAWLALMDHGLDKQQRKDVLQAMTNRVVPWFQNPELLMDFLTDSYDLGGATSLLALSGLFSLMQEKNLDYPNFYRKLYSLLDADLLHSKHRSRFLRLLNTFMSSTHLPAAMVASFIKRLSRLALHGPPAGIVAVVPWVYNMLKAHPMCTFMIHREPRSQEEREFIEQYGYIDPFDMDEPDPMESNAIDSSLWELETLQSHYHPNVASLAKIISEQFTKQSYNLEDFLDYSYNSLIDAELGKELKKSPVVEYEIPKTVFKDASGDATLEELLVQVAGGF